VTLQEALDFSRPIAYGIRTATGSDGEASYLNTYLGAALPPASTGTGPI
jgi:hypothetical protein